MCEYSGEYFGCNMYNYKRNHIQIAPKYRKLFRNKNHTLYIFNPQEYFEYINLNGCFTKIDYEEMNDYKPPFFNKKEFLSKIKQEYPVYNAKGV